MLTLRLKNFLYFLKRKFFLYFRKWNPVIFGHSPKTFSLNKFLIFFPKKSLVGKKFKYFLKKAFLIFRKQNFLILRERYVHNTGIFKTRGIFRTMSNIYFEMFWKEIAHFSAEIQKNETDSDGNIFLIFQEMELFGCNIKKIQETQTLENIPYI